MASRFFQKAGILAASVAAAGLTLTAAPAYAADAVQQPSTTPIHTSGMTFYDDFWTLSECRTVGEWGLDHDKWTVYDCQESPWDWDLYVDS